MFGAAGAAVVISSVTGLQRQNGAHAHSSMTEILRCNSGALINKTQKCLAPPFCTFV